MRCPKCQFEQADGNTECPRCGVIFAKYHEYLDRTTEVTPSEGAPPARILSAAFLKDLLLTVEADVNPFYFFGRALVLMLLLSWSVWLVSFPMNPDDLGSSFMHRVNLTFHEAGHVIFLPLGRFLQILGGTLGQLLMPLTCLCALLFGTRDIFGTSVALWWLGESFMDIAPYIDDARALRLTLLGGATGAETPGSHDWYNILGSLGWLRYDHAIAHFAYYSGVGLVILSLLWGGYALYMQSRNIDEI
ncbi:MAG: zinc ribbon domain-containing protein [Syntrophobacteraceae bacterium]|nr:zinc ribbon domain-containing protein [Desulfobacteraceae bacterium]